MLEKDPKNRISLDDIIDMPYISQYIMSNQFYAENQDVATEILHVYREQQLLLDNSETDTDDEDEDDLTPRSTGRSTPRSRPNSPRSRPNSNDPSQSFDNIVPQRDKVPTVFFPGDNNRDKNDEISSVNGAFIEPRSNRHNRRMLRPRISHRHSDICGIKSAGLGFDNSKQLRSVIYTKSPPRHGHMTRIYSPQPHNVGGYIKINSNQPDHSPPKHGRVTPLTTTSLQDSWPQVRTMQNPRRRHSDKYMNLYEDDEPFSSSDYLANAHQPLRRIMSAPRVLTPQPHNYGGFILKNPPLKNSSPKLIPRVPSLQIPSIRETESYKHSINRHSTVSDRNGSFGNTRRRPHSVVGVSPRPQQVSRKYEEMRVVEESWNSDMSPSEQLRNRHRSVSECNSHPNPILHTQCQCSTCNQYPHQPEICIQCRSSNSNQYFRRYYRSAATPPVFRNQRRSRADEGRQTPPHSPNSLTRYSEDLRIFQTAALYDEGLPSPHLPSLIRSGVPRNFNINRSRDGNVHLYQDSNLSPTSMDLPPPLNKSQYRWYQERAADEEIWVQGHQVDCTLNEEKEKENRMKKRERKARKKTVSSSSNSNGSSNKSKKEKPKKRSPSLKRCAVYRQIEAIRDFLEAEIGIGILQEVMNQLRSTSIDDQKEGISQKEREAAISKLFENIGKSGKNYLPSIQTLIILEDS